MNILQEAKLICDSERVLDLIEKSFDLELK